MVRKLFLTPPDLPSETQCRSIAIPSSQEWLGIFNNALLQLANRWNYEQVHDTDLTPDEVAATCYGIYEDYLAAGGCALDAPPPYWDEGSPEEAGNEDPTETGFPWYEDLSFTFLEGFLATLISPPAAYAYITTVKKLRLFFIYGQHGALFDIQIDGTTVQTVDTYAPTESLGVVDVIVP